MSRHEADAEQVTRWVGSMVSTSRDRPSSAPPGHTPRPHSKLAVPWLIRSSKRRTTGARRSRLMEHAAAGLYKMLSLGHAGFTLTLFDGSASLPKRQLKRQWSVNDRSVPPPRACLFINAASLFFCVRSLQIELELAAARERVDGDEPDFKLDIDMLLGGGRSAGAQPHKCSAQTSLCMAA